MVQKDSLMVLALANRRMHRTCSIAKIARPAAGRWVALQSAYTRSFNAALLGGRSAVGCGADSGIGTMPLLVRRRVPSELAAAHRWGTLQFGEATREPVVYGRCQRINICLHS